MKLQLVGSDFLQSPVHVPCQVYTPRSNLSNQYQQNPERGSTFTSVGSVRTFQNKTLAKAAFK